MNVLVIGSGAREHALLRSFKNSSPNSNLFVYPGNDGHEDAAQIVKFFTDNDAKKLEENSQIINFCLEKKIDFVFIGPESNLVTGLADELRKKNIRCVGPGLQGSKLESSKIFAKEFMLTNQIPTARSFVVSSIDEAVDKATNFSAPYILKADGLAAGKGVYICSTLDDLKTAANELFVLKKFGEAGSVALLEENLAGYEISYLILTNGLKFAPLPLAQDHKRLYDDNQGPNTGGMGTYAPFNISDSLNQKILAKIIEPSVAGLAKADIFFRGILFLGIMVVNDEPYVLEYNVRFGDPETQVILPLIENNTVELFYDLARGQVQPIRLNNKFSVCIVNAAQDYPDNPKRGQLIKFNQKDRDSLLFAGVKKQNDGHYYSDGGRVMNVIAVENSLELALKKAYEINDGVMFVGRHFRKDIGFYQSHRRET